MSDLLLNNIAEYEAEVAVKKMIEEYNNPELTKKGKREVLEFHFFAMFHKGYNLCMDRNFTAKTNDSLNLNSELKE